MNNKNIRKYIQVSLILLGGIFLLGNFSFALNSISVDDNPFPYDVQSTSTVSDSTNLAQVVKNDSVNPPTSLLKRLTNFFRLSGTSYNNGTNTHTATNYVTWILNILLGLVSLIALVLIIYAFYLIFFSKGEEGATKARKILVGVGIALALLGLSWLIVSFLFNIFGVATA